MWAAKDLKWRAFWFCCCHCSVPVLNVARRLCVSCFCYLMLSCWIVSFPLCCFHISVFMCRFMPNGEHPNSWSRLQHLTVFYSGVKYRWSFCISQVCVALTSPEVLYRQMNDTQLLTGDSLRCILVRTDAVLLILQYCLCGAQAFYWRRALCCH